MTEAKGRIGGSFADFLEETGDREAVEAQAVKALLVDQLKAAMAADQLSKAALARRMNTTRAQVDRLLDADSDAVTLRTLQRAARAVGRTLRVELA